jgi:hypothetical protein
MKTKAEGYGYINRITGRWSSEDRAWPEWSWQGMMLLAVAIILGVVIVGVMIGSLTGCGGGTNNHAVVGVTGASNGKWTNSTSLPDEQFFVLMDRKFIEAQLDLEMNPQTLLNGSPARPFTSEELIRIGMIQPRGWRVVGLVSVPAKELNALPGCLHCPYKDPSPFVYCPDNPEFKYCNAYLSDGVIYIPDAYPEFVGPWELGNKILEVAGVDIGYR